MLGTLGWLASAAAKRERAGAERAAGALPASLERIGEAESRAERAYRASVDGQRMADATGIRRLSVAAEMAIGTLRAMPDEKARGEAWRAMQKDEQVAAELDGFRAAVMQRFGDEGVREMLQAAGQPGTVSLPSVASGQQPTVERTATVTVILKQGERAGTDLTQREAERERQGQRRGLRM